MDTKNLLLEIGCEEIPARYIEEIKSNLKANADKLFKENLLDYKDNIVYSTPRRLVLFVEHLNAVQNSVLTEVKGPSEKFAFSNGEPTKALLGFLAGKNKTIDDIYKKNVGSEKYIFVQVGKEPKKTADILPELLKNLITNLPLTRSMKWNKFSFKFIRPIRSILALFGNDIVEFSIENITSGNKTFGHRVLGNKQNENLEANFKQNEKNNDITVGSADITDYCNALSNANVLIYEDERQERIKNQIDAICRTNGVDCKCDSSENKELLNEIVNLVEYPTADMGHFDEKYLSLPEAVVTTPMKDHQRYFPVYKNGKLFNAFIYVRNGDSKNIEIVRKGNEKVLVARLEDAKFFFTEDKKHSLSERAKHLNQIVFRDGLGTMQDKVERIESIAKTIASLVNYTDTEKLIQSAELCKADLLTEVVKEFEELQGTMGKVYGKLEGLDEEVCEAIGEHYYPKFSGDRLPYNKLGAILSVADKLDSIMSSFAINVMPTGSQDPFGLRRQCLGVIGVVSAFWNLDLLNLIVEVSKLYERFTSNTSELVKKTADFFVQRLKADYQSNYKFDEIEAVLNSKYPLIVNNHQKTFKAIKAFKKTNYLPVIESLTRIKNIVEKQKFEETNIELNETMFATQEEIDLFKTLQKLTNNNNDLMLLQSFSSFERELENLNILILPITNLFNNVLIMDKDDKVRNIRLKLLKNVYDHSRLIADITLLK